jgi:hypothetical protein
VGEPVGVAQDVFATDLVVEHVEAEGGLRLRLAIQLSLQGPDRYVALDGIGSRPSGWHGRRWHVGRGFPALGNLQQKLHFPSRQCIA